MIEHRQTRGQWDEKNVAKKGLTLIEVLVVIVILAVLAGVVFFAISSSRDKASKNACIKERDTVEEAVDAYALANDVAVTSIDLTDLTAGKKPQLEEVPKYWAVSGGVLSRTNLSEVDAKDCPV